MNGGQPTLLIMSGLIVDSDLVMPAGMKITVDHIAETTAGHHIVTDDVLACDAVLEVDHIAERTGAHGITADNVTYNFGSTYAFTMAMGAVFTGGPYG